LERSIAMTLAAAYEANNIFAKIIRGEIPSVKVYDDADVLAFMDIYPQTDGHVLVIPKKARAVNLLDTPGEDLKALILAVQKVARAVEKALRPDGVRIMQFNGAQAGQSVFHVHFHIVPVYAEKPVRAHATGAPADGERLKEFAKRISAAL
jgi:histidine triad (HIT) family protein